MQINGTISKGSVCMEQPGHYLICQYHISSNFNLVCGIINRDQVCYKMVRAPPEGVVEVGAVFYQIYKKQSCTCIQFCNLHKA